MATGFSVTSKTAGIMKTVQGYQTLSSVNYHKHLLFRCSLCLDNKKVEETARKVINDTIQETLPSIIKTALEQRNLGEMSRTVTELKMKLSH